MAITPAGNAVVLPGVTPDPAATWGEVAPSPDGRTFVAARQRDGHWALVRWRADAVPAAGPEVLYRSATIVTDPAWTGDGAVLFVTEVGGYPQVVRWRDAHADKFGPALMRKLSNDYWVERIRAARARGTA